MLVIGCDHGGFELKREIVRYMDEQNIPYKDVGTHSAEAVDYPAYARRAADEILSGRADMGVLICGTGIGISIAANKIAGIRAAVCNDVYTAKVTRLHNDANILAMGGRVIGAGAALEIFKAFYGTGFSGESRHVERLRQITELEKQWEVSNGNSGGYRPSADPAQDHHVAEREHGQQGVQGTR